MAGRVGVRNTLAAFISNPPIENLNQVFTSFPKRINYQVNSQPGQLTRSAVVVFIAAETETRLAIGGATSGWKRVDLHSCFAGLYALFTSQRRGCNG
jgi:hypothetical protein